MRRQPRRPFENRAKREAAAFVIPLFGVIILLPPFVNLFIRKELIFGVPVDTVYLFLVWAILVATAFGLSSWLPKAEPPVDGEDWAGGPAAPPEER